MEKQTAATRVLLCMVVLMFVGVTALAQDSKSSTITINGGRTTVSMKSPSTVVHNRIVQPASPFYNNIGTGYQAGTGWTISDGSPIDTEYTPGNQIVSLKSGTTKHITVGVGFVTGTNSARVTLDKDCKGIPCGVIDKTHMCRGTIKNLPVFGSTSTTTKTFTCKVPLKKGKPYWVYVESADNSWLAWNLSTSALGGLIEGTNDVWGSPSSGAQVGALIIK